MFATKGNDSLRVQLRSLAFSGGQKLELRPDSIVVLVGPNNAGKTSTLREVLRNLERRENGPVLAAVEWEMQGDEDALRAWLDANVHARKNDYTAEKQWGWLDHTVDRSALTAFWTYPGGQRSLAPILVNLLSVENRLQISLPPDVQALRDSTPRHPIHAIVLKDGIEQQISGQLRACFGAGIVLNRSLTSKCEVYVGDPPPKDAAEDRASPSYVRRLQSLPRLEDEGHGIRSYFGCLLGLLASPGQIHLIDEPECFLHPPHARRLGRALVELAPPERQILIATHSPEVLQGVVDASSTRVTIVRLVRSEGRNDACVLESARLRQLWTDPLLRYSNVLQGLFNENVVICEGEADCRFYEAMCDASTRAEGATQRSVLFTSTAGKDRMATVARALRTLGVPTRVVVDLDVLQAAASLENLVDAMGGEWSQLRKDWQAVVKSMEQMPLTASVSVEHLQVILRDNKGSYVSDETAKRIRHELPADSGWAAVKKAGTRAFPDGQTQDLLRKLIAQLRRLGVFVVEVGELERFAPTVGNHGARWLAEVMGRDLATDAELREAREFAKALVAPL